MINKKQSQIWGYSKLSLIVGFWFEIGSQAAWLIADFFKTINSMPLG